MIVIYSAISDFFPMAPNLLVFLLLQAYKHGAHLFLSPAQEQKKKYRKHFGFAVEISKPLF